MANRFGTRRVFSGAIGLFALGSLLCGLARNIHLLVALRVLQGCGGAMMVPVGRLTLVRSFAKSQLVRAMTFVAIPSLVGPMLGPIAGGMITGYLHWSVIFFLNVPIGIVGLYLVYRHLPDYRETRTSPLDVLGLVLFSSGIALLSYVLEVFGEHRLATAAILELLVLAALLLSGYGLNAVRTRYPLLRLDLFRIRTFRAAVSGSFFTRISIAGVPFLLPLLYQVGLGYSPIQSGLLLAPHVYADVSDRAASGASTIASTAQQLSMSFGVASASLVAALFIPDRFRTDAPQLIHGIHEAFVVLGAATIVSTLVFASLRSTDGSAVSQHRADLPAA
jgi:EmrB/QacA subfamily drug resistance transporter